MIIAIDGYSATGKSTLAGLLAKKIGFRHLNSGLVFRAISYNLLTKGVDKSNFKDNIDKIKELTQLFHINLEELERNILKLKAPEVSELGIQIAKLPFIRERVTEVLRAAATNSNIVVEGRDIGTVLFPKADIKFFFKADTTIRAKRLGRERNSNDYEAMKRETETRDKEDETREISPLKRADDAIDIDTSNITVEETLELLERFVNEIKK
jgi:cytidylate kinase